MIDALNAVGTLRNASPPAGPAATPVAGTQFSDVLADVSGQAVNAIKGAEATAITGIEGKASVQHVVEAILSAEQTLQTALAVRDKVVAAYQEISRMQI
ncbi:flagellar hook-basal body complex protein FliE [Ancylobacter lacus]|uniref:flagellar hook-basal body complex protein FliE n=1 Tax=Ancylobacter lacus TaxID=2579970 RepID=UPI001BCEC0F5|nr:flagellar hook-basal body complex protein FliE [Ancylobacter lacus]MBS7537943.1 flagellar hook-basal body complex protein FliE [Ancylobacter lacus]